MLRSTVQQTCQHTSAIKEVQLHFSRFYRFNPFKSLGGL